MKHALLLILLLAPAMAKAQQDMPAPDYPDQTLTEKLKRSEGVITPPPSGDGEMTQTPPDVGATMPVIPPSSVPPSESAPGDIKPEAR